MTKLFLDDHQELVIIDTDIDYFRNKVQNAIDEQSRRRAQRQLRMIEDSIIIYRLS